MVSPRPLLNHRPSLNAAGVLAEIIGSFSRDEIEKANITVTHKESGMVVADFRAGDETFKFIGMEEHHITDMVCAMLQDLIEVETKNK